MSVVYNWPKLQSWLLIIHRIFIGLTFNLNVHRVLLRMLLGPLRLFSPEQKSSVFDKLVKLFFSFTLL